MRTKLGFAVVVLAGVTLGGAAAIGWDRACGLFEWAVASKPECGNPGMGAMWRVSRAWTKAEKRHPRPARKISEDPELKIAEYAIGSERYWVPSEGEELSGAELLHFLLVEHSWMEEANPEEQVKPGDVVVDCGAHVGVFVRKALNRGASRVLAVEPALLNLECLRRNFKPEIEEGRVIVVPKGAWDSEGKLKFRTSRRNSGNNSLVYEDERDGEIEIGVSRIDKIAEDAGLRRIDYLKMDIEGAERRALAGAIGVLRRDKPTLAVEFYHLEDDPVVLPSIIQKANPSYRRELGPCSRMDGRGWRPHVVYFR
jgi:FkbM family methyltransferase